MGKSSHSMGSFKTRIKNLRILVSRFQPLARRSGFLRLSRNLRPNVYRLVKDYILLTNADHALHHMAKPGMFFAFHPPRFAAVKMQNIRNTDTFKNEGVNV